MFATARFFNGKVAKVWPVSVSASPEDLRIHDAGATEPRAVWPAAALRLLQAESGNLPLILGTALDADARLVVTPGEGAALMAALGVALAPPERLSTAPLALAGWAAAALAVFGLSALAIPWFAEVAAPYAPPSWRDHLGRYVVRDMTRGHARCDAKTGAAALRHLTEQVAPQAMLDVAVSDDDTVNAFAAPGGHVVVYRGMLDEAQTPAELASVLAHEYGHVMKEHPTAAAIRILGLTLAGQVMLGIDAGKAAPAAAFYSLTYNRRDELAADKIAASIMQRLGDAKAMADLFHRFSAKDKHAGGGAETYFSTHPGWEERIAAISGGEAADTAPLITDAEWQALKQICGKPDGG